MSSKPSKQPASDVPADLYTAEEIAEYLKVDPKTVLNWAKSGIIPEALRVGRTVRFSLEAVKSSLSVNCVDSRKKVKKKNGRVRGAPSSEAFDSDSGWWQTSQFSPTEK